MASRTVISSSSPQLPYIAGSTKPEISSTRPPEIVSTVSAPIRNTSNRVPGPYAALRSGPLASLSDDVRRVLGWPPRDFSGYARTAAAQGACRA